MIYQLCSGNSVEISTEVYFSMRDDEFVDSITYHTIHNETQPQENPWFGSVLARSSSDNVLEKFPEAEPDAADMTPAEKLQELDLEPTEE